MSLVETRYAQWSRSVDPSTDLGAELAEELRRIADDPAAIEDRFYRELEFGTGGLRGILGAGTNRMNVYTVRKATQGLSGYLLSTAEAPSVAIAYDSRIHSRDFAQAAAEVFAANGIRVYLYPQLMPTPALSFAVRDLGCSGGVVVTASHNPAQYNGYKVYGADGCQITTQAAKEIQARIDGVDAFADVRAIPFQDALSDGRISYIKPETEGRYLAAVSAASVVPERVDKDISIVYTPLNGAGINCVWPCLTYNGFRRITIPPEQKEADGNFPTCPYPNPEEPSALEVGLRAARAARADLLLATDPDSDRVGVAVRHKDEYVRLSGNEMGVLLLDFVCRMRRINDTMPRDPVAVKTIVTTPMAQKIAGHYGVELRDVLTGFKFIGEQIGLLEHSGEARRFIFGFEESCGYLSGSFVRDKDAVNACLLICEMTAWYRQQGRTLVDVLNELYDTYGFYATRLLSFQFPGAAGFERMQALMEGLRKSPPAAIGGLGVEERRDYLTDGTGLPKSNVLRFFLDGGAEVVVRPSGTEPKLKAYLTAVGSSAGQAQSRLDELERSIRGLTGL